MQEISVQFLSWKDPLEEEMATHSSFLAWEIPCTEDRGKLQSLGCKELDLTEWLSTYTKTKIILLRYPITVMYNLKDEKVGKENKSITDWGEGAIVRK